MVYRKESNLQTIDGISTSCIFDVRYRLYMSFLFYISINNLCTEYNG